MLFNTKQNNLNIDTQKKAVFPRVTDVFQLKESDFIVIENYDA